MNIAMDKEDLKKGLERQLAEIDEKMEVLDMMDERLLKIKKFLQEIEASDLTKDEEIEIRNKIKLLEDELNLLNREKNLQS